MKFILDVNAYFLALRALMMPFLSLRIWNATGYALTPKP